MTFLAGIVIGQPGIEALSSPSTIFVRNLVLLRNASWQRLYMQKLTNYYLVISNLGLLKMCPIQCIIKNSILHKNVNFWVAIFYIKKPRPSWQFSCLYQRFCCLSFWREKLAFPDQESLHFCKARCPELSCLLYQENKTMPKVLTIFFFFSL